jgi:segregation and condensation protein A
MADKTIPWWRKALEFAMGGIRSGFGLFSRPAKPESLEEDQFLQSPEASEELEEVLTHSSPNPEVVAHVPEAVAEQAPAAEPLDEPSIVAEAVLASDLPQAEPVDLIEEPAIPDDLAEQMVVPAPPQEPLLPMPVPEPDRQSEPESAPEPEPEPDPKAEQAPESEPLPAAETAPMAEKVPAVVAAAEPAAGQGAEPPTPPATELASDPVPEPAQAPKPLIKLESRDNEADLSPFSVIVAQVYDGPLDLLLDLIRKQDIDIYDIPIAKITAQFLAYVNQLKATDVDVAGEFIYTASLLIHIKSKMLLPRSPSGPDDAAEDPRRELVERLLEHERFKNAAQMLQQKQMLEAATWTNPGFREFREDAAAEPEIEADTVDLVRIFRDILERARNRPVLDVEEDTVTVGQMIQFLARRLTMEDKPVALRRLLSHTRSERALIAMFLALLELVRLQAVLLRQDLAFSEIFIKKHTSFEAVMNEGLANARDDWK